MVGSFGSGRVVDLLQGAVTDTARDEYPHDGEGLDDLIVAEQLAGFVVYNL